MIGFSVIGAVLMLTLWNARPRAHGAAVQASAEPLPAPQPAPRTGTDA
jgi:MFS transporter, OPA family, glycerol-3-phosphate transporter